MTQVVITGSTKGLGLALAEEFLRLGDSVVISSRDDERCHRAAADLSASFPASAVRCYPADIGVSEQVGTGSDRNISSHT